MTPEEMIFTFKQGSEESFKEAWSRINESYDKTKPKMTLGLLLTSFYFGLVHRYRYGMDTLVGGDFLQNDGDQAFNTIKRLITIYSIPNSFDSSIASIYAIMNTLETNMTCSKECNNQLREKVDYVPINSESSGYLSTIKVTIDRQIVDARCDIMSEFCLMPKDIYESLNLWGLSEGGEEVSLTNNSVILPIGIAEGVFTKNLGRTVSTDYLVIECVGKGQITIGRSLLKLLRAKIDVGNGLMTSNSPLGGSHSFPNKKAKGKKGKHAAPKTYVVDAPPLDNT